MTGLQERGESGKLAKSGGFEGGAEGKTACVLVLSCRMTHLGARSVGAGAR